MLQKPSDFYISQSSAHKWKKVLAEQYCGKLFAHEVLEEKEDEEETDSTAMALGRYFEWVAIGNPSRDGSIPEAERYKNNTKYGKKGEVKGDFKHADVQAKRLIQALEYYGLKVIDKNVTIHDHLYKIRGTFDCIVQVPEDRWEEFACTYMENGQLVTRTEGQPNWEDCQWTGLENFDGEDMMVTYKGAVVLDLKYSGLLDVPFKEHSFHLDSMIDNDKHSTQAKTYAWLSKLPFYFVVASSKDMNMRFIRALFDENTLEEHVRLMCQFRASIVANLRSYFTVSPSMKHCGSCPLAEDCDKKAVAPWIDVVHWR